jgi:hypothetical protein
VKQYIYKIIIVIIAIIVVYEFTIGKEISKLNEKIESFGSVEGRKKIVESIKKEIRKANERENYLDQEERELLKNFIIKIKKELN